MSQVNDQGGINGKKINAIIPTFTPTNTAEMRSLCKDWTEGSPAAFAVVDGIGHLDRDKPAVHHPGGSHPADQRLDHGEHMDHQGVALPVVDGPADTVVLQATVNWGLSAGLLGGTHKVGVVVGDRASDQDALHKYLLPDLQRAGVTPVVETIPADPTETAATNADAPLVVQKLKADGRDSI